MASWNVDVCVRACVCVRVCVCVRTCIAKLRSESGTSWSAASCQGGGGRRGEEEERCRGGTGESDIKNEK